MTQILSIPLQEPNPRKKKGGTSWIFLVLAALSLPLTAQDFSRSSNLAWAGGMNACQYGSIDLDLDGTSDLLVFDRHGNRILPFRFAGVPGAPDYRYDTSFVRLFPDLHDWVITADYDCDGRMDLFTYGLGSIRVFRNTSEECLSFELVTEMVTSWFYTGKVGILVTPVDYPVIADIDGDGDLDILTFFGLGSFVEYHQNMSMERFGTCDSLDFRLNTNCWGKFKESEGNNKITLNAICPGSNPDGSFIRQGDRHTGSTLLTIDLTHNGLPDLLLADIDYPNLIALYNNGTPDSALMTAIDTLFPSNTKPVWLFDFPVTCLLDADHDGLDDLLLSSFNPSLQTAQDQHSSWFYRNTGTQEVPQFTFITSQYLQEHMIDLGSGSYPLLADLNRDGLTDLIIGCWGTWDSSYYYEGQLRSVFTSRISYYRNTGSFTRPVFTRITDDLADLSLLGVKGLYPAIADLNGDGWPDMLIGQEDGTLLYMVNAGTGADPPEFLEPQFRFQDIDVGFNCAPQLFDLDGDGLADLIAGERNGNLNYFRNTGTPSDPLFALVTDSLGKVNVTDYLVSYTGYSAPCFFRDPQGNPHLIVGSETGKLWYFDPIPDDFLAPYPESDSLFIRISGQPFPMTCGWRTAPAIGLLTDASRFDLITGNWAGGLNYFSHSLPPDVLMPVEANPVRPSGSFRIYPNPAGATMTVEITGLDPAEELYLKVVNLPGQVVILERVSSGTTLSTLALPKGLYLVILTGHSSGNPFPVRKLIINR